MVEVTPREQTAHSRGGPTTSVGAMSGKPARAPRPADEPRPTEDADAAAATPAEAPDRPADHRSVAARVFAILDAFSTPPSATSLSLTAIAERAGLPLSTAHRLVREWVEWGGLERQPDGHYTLGLRLWELGVRAPTAHNLRTIAMPYLEDLYESAHEHVHLAILDGTDALYLEKLSGHRAVPIASRVGGRLPLHSTGVGLVLLAYAAPAFVEDYLARGLRQFLPQTMTSPDALRKRLATIRGLGLAVMSEEMTAGSSSIAAPIRDRTGNIVAAISVVVRTDPDDLLRFEHDVRLAARGASRALGWRGAS